MAGHKGGHGKCSVCASPRKDEVEEGLARLVPLRTLEKRFDLDKDALANHRRNHLSPALLALSEVKGAVKVLDDLIEARDAAILMYEAARAVRNMPLALASNRQRIAGDEVIARITGELDDRPQVTVNIQQSTAFIAVRSVIFEELEDYPEVRASISRRLRVLAETGIDPGATG